MKSFIISVLFFVVVLFGVVFYQFALEKRAEEINQITFDIQKCAENNDAESFKNTTEELSRNFEKVKNWLMAFEDHEQILEMAQCIQEIKAYSEAVDDPAVMIGLNKFRYLLNYSVESLKPTLENIF